MDNIVEPEAQRDVWQPGTLADVWGFPSEEDVGCLMDGELDDLVVTDATYNGTIESDSAKFAADGRSRIQDDDMPAEKFAGFLHAVFVRYSSLMESTAGICVTRSSSYQREFEDAINAASIVIRSQ